MTRNTAPIFDTARQFTGKTIIDFTGNSESLTLQADGKILVAGYTSGYRDFSLIRLNTDGTLDTSFSRDGKAIFDVGGSDDYGKDLTVQADGKILIAGQSFTSNGSWDFSLIRLNAYSTRDTSFSAQPRWCGTELNAFDGMPDTSFSGDGKATFDIGGLDDSGRSLTVQADGKILVAGSSSNGSNEDFSVIRLNANGTLDTSFSGDGKATFDIGGYSDYGQSLTLQSDGKILVAGYSGHYNDYSYSVIRLNTNGTLDTTFSGDGKALIDVGSFSDYANSLAVQSDGKILVAGSSVSSLRNSDFSVIRLNANGTLDTSFSGDGKALFDISGYYLQKSLTVQADGKILVSGCSKYDNGPDSSFQSFSVIRLNANGTLDTTFSSDGKATFDIGGHDNNYSLTLQSNGKIVIAGTSYTNGSANFNVIRLNANGTLDNTFGSQTSSLGGTVGYITGAPAIALDTHVAVYDAELAALNGGLGNYSGASVTLNRHGGASSYDVFSGLGSLSLLGGSAVLSGITVGAVSNTGGKLVITFNANATQALVNQTLSSIGYANSSSSPSTSGQIDWLFSDGDSTGALTVAGSTTVNIGITLTGTGNADTLIGAAEDDTLIGLGGNDVLQGLAGNDILDGGAGADTMIGGDGNDTYYVDDEGDVVSESYYATASTGGTDRVYSYLNAYTLGANVENGRILASGTASLTGNSLNNVLYAGAGNNVLDGAAGTDTVSYKYAIAGVGVNLATTTAQATGGSGSDTLKNVERLIGSKYADKLTGNSGNNALSGGAGNDTLTGGLGADRLTGGTGADRFDFNSLAEMGLASRTWDTITDFKTSEGDKIDLQGVDANTALAGDQAFTFLGSVSTFIGDATGKLRFDAVTHTLYGSTDADTAAEFAIALTGVSSLSAADFIL